MLERDGKKGTLGVKGEGAKCLICESGDKISKGGEDRAIKSEGKKNH